MTRVFVYSLGSEHPFASSVVTNETGGFRFDALPVGRHLLSLEEDEEPLGTLSRELNAGAHDDEITVTADRTTRHDLQVLAQRTVVLRLTHRGKPSTGTAVELVRLNARGEAKWTITISTSRDKRDHGTDGGGRIDFHGVTDGRYAVVVAAGPWSIGCGTLDVRGADEETVFHEVELGSHEVVVRVVDVQGRPVTEAQPGIASADPWVGATMRPSRNVVAADGHYVVPFIPSGRFRAYVNAKGDIHASSGEFIVDDDTEKATVTVEMPLTGVLSVRVVTASGRPVRDAEVSVDRSGETPYYHHRTDGNGTLERTVAAEGEWIVRVRRGAESDVESARVIVEPYSKTVVNVTVDKPMK